MKICPTCARHFSDQERFCPACAHADGTAMPLRSVGQRDPGREAITIGEQAVVSGEIIGHQEQHIYQGTAHVTQMNDDTKAVHTCAVCGIKGTIERGFHSCPGCARTVCAAHFDAPARLCVDCRDAARTVREDIYRQHAARHIEAGKLIDPWERQELELARQALGLTAVDAANLEQMVKRSLPDASWGAEQQRQLDGARRLLLERDDPRQALSYLEALVERYPGHHELQAVWLEALGESDPERALALTERTTADVPAVYIVRARLVAARGRFQEAIDLLNDARGKPHLEMGRLHFIAASVEILLRHFLATGNRLFLADAEARLAEAHGSSDAYVATVTAWYDHLMGDPQALARLAVIPPENVHMRRVKQFIDHLPVGGTPRPLLTGKVIRSHKRQRAVVWSASPGGDGDLVRAHEDEPEASPSAETTRTFQRLQPAGPLAERQSLEPRVPVPPTIKSVAPAGDADGARRSAADAQDQGPTSA